MYRFRIMLMRKKPTINDLVRGELSKDSKAVFLAAFRDAKREQDKMLKKAKKMSRSLPKGAEVRK